MKKPPKLSILEKRKVKKLKNMSKAGRLVKGVIIPKGSLPGNPDNQSHPSSLSVHYFYNDINYTCAGCGIEQVWTAKQQKRYYEEQKGIIYNKPKWCRECHIKRMQKRLIDKVKNEA